MVFAVGREPWIESGEEGAKEALLSFSVRGRYIFFFFYFFLLDNNPHNWFGIESRAKGMMKRTLSRIH